jgi:hypothetical protein
MRIDPGAAVIQFGADAHGAPDVGGPDRGRHP